VPRRIEFIILYEDVLEEKADQLEKKLTQYKQRLLNPVIKK
jgi:hypothetical protein